MSSVSSMLNLKDFQKMGVRVPSSLKRRVKQLILDMDEAGVRLDGEELTMEAVFAASVLNILAMKKADQAKLLTERVVELVSLFEAEMPGAKENPVDDGVYRDSVVSASDENKSGTKKRERGKKDVGSG